MQSLDYLRLVAIKPEYDKNIYSFQVQINLITNFTDEVLARHLAGVCLANGVYPSIYQVPYKQYAFAFHDETHHLFANNAAISFVFFDVHSALANEFVLDVQHMNDVLVGIEHLAMCGGVLVACTLQTPYCGSYGNLYDASPLMRTVNKFNEELKRLAKLYSAIHVFDINRLFHFFGEENARDARTLYRFDIPFTNAFFSRIAEDWFGLIRTVLGVNKKCIVVDLDNTLWGGVVGEKGALGIELGSTYPGNVYLSFQRALCCYKERGILLAINSRNNETDVFEVFEKNPQMLLKRSDFATMQINWENKAQNLIKIAKDLNIGLDSLVFVDDDPMNCALVKEILPQVTVVPFVDPPETFLNTLFKTTEFHQLRLTKEDFARAQMATEENERRNLLSSVRNIDEYIDSLGIKVEVHFGLDALPRLSQLTQKTNQFNLTTHRYTEADLCNIVETGGLVFSGEVSDRYGAYGLSVMAIVSPKQSDILDLDTFLMSCRIMGRGVEYKFLDAIIRSIYHKGVRVLSASFFPTAKNIQARNFLSEMNFKIISEEPNGVTSYSLDIEKYLSLSPSLIRSSIILTNQYE